MKKTDIGRGVVYLYIEAITLLFSGYIFWLILSKITTPSIIGTSSTVLSLSTIFISIASLSISSGILGFIGKSISETQTLLTRRLINSSLLLVTLGISGSCLVMILIKDWLFYSFQLDLGLFVLSILIIALSVFSSLFKAIIIPTLKTNTIAISSLIATTLKISIAIILVLLGMGVTGILVGFLLYPLVSTIILSRSIKRKFYRDVKLKNGIMRTSYLFQNTRDILQRSIAFWIPSVITAVGSQLGTIFIYIINGANNAGIYFISLSIVTGISLITSVFSSIAYPIISSLNDGRKRTISRLIKLTVIITLPVSNILIFYSNEVLLLFGSHYAIGSANLQILLLSIFPTVIITWIGVLVYAYGNNRQVLLIGLFTSIPRILLYFVFVPLFGGNGAAISYLLGTLVGCIISIYIARLNNFKINWKQMGYLFCIPLVFGALLSYSQMQYIIAIIISLGLSYLTILILRLINEEDIEDILTLLPANFIQLIAKVKMIIQRFRPF